MSERRYLSIGEVLGLLLEEFPDVTISKIRFLESQGLIDPERTPSGYRKFYDEDVERLRVILREQRENFLPLKVIRDRLETGELVRETDPTPTGSIRLPRSSTRGAGTTPPPLAASHRTAVARPPSAPLTVVSVVPASPLTSSVASADDTTNGRTLVALSHDAVDDTGPLRASAAARPAARLATQRGEAGLTAEELCGQAGVDLAFLDQLESFGVVASSKAGGWRTYDGDSIRAVMAAAQLCARGLEPRHLRQWRHSVDREMALIEQLVLPLLRQRNPAAREHAADLAMDVERLGEELRAALASKALRHLIG